MKTIRKIHINEIGIISFIITFIFTREDGNLLSTIYLCLYAKARAQHQNQQ